MRAEIVNKSNTSFWKARSLPNRNKAGAPMVSGATYAVVGDRARRLPSLAIDIDHPPAKSTWNCSTCEPPFTARLRDAPRDRVHTRRALSPDRRAGSHPPAEPDWKSTARDSLASEPAGTDPVSATGEDARDSDGAAKCLPYS